MANKNIFTGLKNTLAGWDSPNLSSPKTNDYSYSSKILYKGNDREEYERTKSKAKQDKALGMQWKKINNEINTETTLNNLNTVQIMYRDCDLMDAFPEIGAALDIYAEEVCTVNEKGSLLNIYSESERVKAVLEDLFTNRLQIHTVLPMVVRATCKYGNNYQLLNITTEEGIVGWRQLPVFYMLRDEGNNLLNFNNKKEGGTTFTWRGMNETAPFHIWQIAHFRILMDSIYLPYGVSILHKARRAWRQLALMEDMMLVYRLERSFERRVYKINVGAIDDVDVPAFIDDIANNFKRAPIVDPLTGQLDLKKNILGVDQDIFVPVRGENVSNPIDVLPGATNLDKIEDLSYIQRKIFSALRLPKSFLNFDETTGDGKNLAIMDVRFAKMVNRIQQAILLELNKIATIHLYLKGFKDNLNDFTLTMNNPSTQAEMLRLDETQKRVTLARDALSDPGNGIQLMSWVEVQKNIFHKNEEEIAELLNEIRLETGVAGELTQTREIIKRSGLFDDVDKLYGEPNAQYSDPTQQMGGEGGDGGFGGGGSGGLGGDLGDEDFDMSGEDDMNGESEDMSINDVDTKMENKNFIDKKVINEFRKHRIERPTTKYIKMLEGKNKPNTILETKLTSAKAYDNDKLQELYNKIDNLE